jgi:hypothetical protein
MPKCGNSECPWPNCQDDGVILPPAIPLKPTQERIVEECDRVKELLLAKNASYGDSATNPMRLFSKASAEEGIRIRIDDKLSRIARGQEIGEDTVLDLIGYLVLLRVVRAAR